jgi:hypothetical protein
LFWIIWSFFLCVAAQFRPHNTKKDECRTYRATIYCAKIVSIFYWETSKEFRKPYQPSLWTWSCGTQMSVESHSQVFDHRRPWHFLTVTYNSSARKSPWRPVSSEINGLCFRSVRFYLPLFEAIRQWVELRLEPILTFISSELDTNMEVSSANVASSHPSAVGASEVNKLYKVGDKTASWGTPYEILYRRTTWTYRYWPGKYVH